MMQRRRRGRMLTILGLIILFISGCRGNENQDTASESAVQVSYESETSSPNADATESKNILVAYFSRAGENYNVGYVEVGNTELIAGMIVEETDGDSFKIQTVEVYPESYEETRDQVQEEKENQERPLLADTIENFESYDVIFLGYPIWWADLPMPMYTFLESYDFSGKTIIPFCTHEGSGSANTKATIQAEATGATVLEPLAIRGEVAQNSREEAKEEVNAWLQNLEFPSEQ